MFVSSDNGIATINISLCQPGFELSVDISITLVFLSLTSKPSLTGALQITTVDWLLIMETVSEILSKKKK